MLTLESHKMTAREQDALCSLEAAASLKRRLPAYHIEG